jgi:hypothetical protein
MFLMNPFIIFLSLKNPTGNPDMTTNVRRDRGRGADELMSHQPAFVRQAFRLPCKKRDN